MCMFKRERYTQDESSLNTNDPANMYNNKRVENYKMAMM